MPKKTIKFYEDAEKTLQVYPELDPEEIPAGVKELLTEGSTITGGGSSLTLDSDILKIKDLQLLGDTSQKSYSGKNLFNINDVTRSGSYNYGTNNATPIFTPHAARLTIDPTHAIKVQPNTKYTFKIGSSFGFAIGELTSDKLTNGDTGWKTGTQTITTKSNTAYIVFNLRKNSSENWNEFSDTDWNNFLQEKAQLEQGQSATDYEPFVGGIPSPNPSYPQDINVVTGNQTIKVLGKNLYETLPSDVNLNGLTPNINIDGSISVNGTISQTWSNITKMVDIYLRPGTYTFSVSKTYNYRCIMRCFHNKIQEGAETNYTNVEIASGNTSKTITFTDSVYHLRFYITGATAQSEINEIFKIQLEVGSTATSFEKYTQQTKTISLGNIELNKIGNYQDKIYKNNDKWYLRKEIMKRIFDGSETYIIGNALTNTTDYRINSNIGAIATGYDEINFYTDRFKTQVGATSDIECSWLNGYGYIRFRINNSIASTIEEFKEWAKNNNITAYYIMATPITTEITDTTLINQLNSIELNNGQNNIYVLSENDNLPVLLNIEAYTNVIDILDLKADKNDIENMGNGIPIGSIIGWNGDDSEIPGGYEIIETEENLVSIGNLTELQKTNLYKKITQNDVVFNHTTIYNGGENWDNNTITSPYIYMTKGSIITFNNEVMTRITRYDDNKEYVSNTGSYIQINSYTIPADAYYRIGLAANSSLELKDGETLVNFVGYTEKLEINSSNLLEWQYGSIDSNGKITSSQNRIISSLLQVAKGTIIKPLSIYSNNRYVYCIDKYDYEGNYIDSIQWNSTTNVIDKDCQIRIRLAYSSGRNITQDDMQIIPKILYIKRQIPKINVLDNRIYECSAHRGSYNIGIPENTIVAYKFAKSQNFYSIETDVRMTSDHIPVICHDGTINRTARNSDGTTISGDIAVASHTFDELNQYDYGIYKGSQYAGTPLLTFDEVMKFAKYYNIKVNIDCKVTANSDIDIIYNVVRKYGMQYQTRWTVANVSVANYLLTKNSKLEIALGAWTPTITDVNNIKTLMDNNPYAIIEADFYTGNITNEIKEAIQNNDIILSCYCENNTQVLTALTYGASKFTLNNYLPYELFIRTYDNQ